MNGALELTKSDIQCFQYNVIITTSLHEPTGTCSLASPPLLSASCMELEPAKVEGCLEAKYIPPLLISSQKHALQRGTTILMSRQRPLEQKPLCDQEVGAKASAGTKTTRAYTSCSRESACGSAIHL